MDDHCFSIDISDGVLGLLLTAFNGSCVCCDASLYTSSTIGFQTTQVILVVVSEVPLGCGSGRLQLVKFCGT